MPLPAPVEPFALAWYDGGRLEQRRGVRAVPGLAAA